MLLKEFSKKYGIPYKKIFDASYGLPYEISDLGDFKEYKEEDLKASLLKNLKAQQEKHKQKLDDVEKLIDILANKTPL